MMLMRHLFKPNKQSINKERVGIPPALLLYRKKRNYAGANPALPQKYVKGAVNYGSKKD